MGIYIYNTEQIQRIEDSCRIAVAILDELEDMVKENVSTYELDRFTREYLKRRDAKPAFLGYKNFPAALCTSINDIVVHGIPDKKVKLKEGDIIGIDVGVFYKGYFGDSARTYRVGRVNSEAKLLLKVTNEALYEGIRKCIEGNRISDISNAIETYVIQYGYSPVREFEGHGVGRNLHEEPSIPNFGKAGKGSRIDNGMVFAIEPMINAGTYMVDVLDDGWTVVTKDRKLSAHFEHTVAVVDGKAKILTRSSKQ